MTPPGIEPRYSGPLANTLTAGPMSQEACLWPLVSTRLYTTIIRFFRPDDSPIFHEKINFLLKKKILNNFSCRIQSKRILLEKYNTPVNNEGWILYILKKWRLSLSLSSLWLSMYIQKIYSLADELENWKNRSVVTSCCFLDKLSTLFSFLCRCGKAQIT